MRWSNYFDKKFLFGALLGVAAALVLFFIGISFILPTDDMKHARWLAENEHAATTSSQASSTDFFNPFDKCNPAANRDCTAALEDHAFKVEWYVKAEKLSLSEADAILKQIDPSGNFVREAKKTGGELCGSGTASLCSHLLLYKAGVFRSPKILAGTEVYYWFSPTLAEGPGPTYGKFLIFVHNGSVYSIVGPEVDLQGMSTHDLITAHFRYAFPELQLPRVLTVKGKPVDLVTYGFEGSVIFSDYMPYDNAGGLKSLWQLSDKVKENDADSLDAPLTDADYAFDTEDGRRMFFKDGCYRLPLPNGAVGQYNPDPPFLGKAAENDVDAFYVEVDWDRLENNAAAYKLYFTLGSCGQADPCTNIVNGQEWFKEDNLAQIGRTKLGDPVYELKDKAENSFYKNFFWKYVYGFSGTNSTTAEEDQKYQEFLKDQPVFFWKDSFNHWRAYKKANYIPLAECGGGTSR